MPTGASIYVQVPDTYSHQDILQWRQEFVTAFDFYEVFDEPHRKNYIEEYVFSIALYGCPDILCQGKSCSAWEVFTHSAFLEVSTMLAYYRPGYERGSVNRLIEVGNWIDDRIPGSVVWYGADCTGIVWPFTRSVREIFDEYFQLVGWKPYRANKENWRELRGKYLREIEQAERVALNELKRQHGIT